MKSIESRIPRFYDVLDEELENSRYIEELFAEAARQHGFMQMRTTSMELRERYVGATQVHPSRLFEVRRVKEGSRYALQADLAMSMSRFVADLTSPPPLKLAQVGTLYRDRQPNLPGFRREFQQMLLGTWGVRSAYADAEVIAVTYRLLERIPGIKPAYVQLSDFNIFNVVRPELAQVVRFEKRGIEEVLAEVEELSPHDRHELATLFAQGRMPADQFVRACADIEHPGIQAEVRAIADVVDRLTPMLPEADISYSLSHIYGTGHYSGMNYQIYVTAPTMRTPFCMGDGGRIDLLCKLLNRNDVPGVCMGLGLTVLAQVMSPLPRAPRVVILADLDKSEAFAKQAEDIRGLLVAQGMHCAVLPLSRRRWGSVLRSEFYKKHAFVLIEDNRVSVRHTSEAGRLLIERVLRTGADGRSQVVGGDDRTPVVAHCAEGHEHS